MSTQEFYSISDIARETGKSRPAISGIISGAKIPTYRGVNNSKLVSAKSYRKIKAALQPKPEYEPRSKSKKVAV